LKTRCAFFSRCDFGHHAPADGRRPVVRTVVLLALAVVSSLSLDGSTFAGDRPDLTGRVMTSAGSPLGGARVMIYTAGVKRGTSSFCPSCYADCAKSATSDAGGAFRIASLDPELVFRVLVVAEGCKPQFLDKVDPAAGAVEAKLEALPTDIEPGRLFRGRVVDDAGRPVVGATVSPFGATERGLSVGGVDGADPAAVTNAAGEFLIVCQRPGLWLDVEVSARGLADRRFVLLEAGRELHELKLHEGGDRHRPARARR
jgi:hypothetical protein